MKIDLTRVNALMTHNGSVAIKKGSLELNNYDIEYDNGLSTKNVWLFTGKAENDDDLLIWQSCVTGYQLEKIQLRAVKEKK